MQRPPTKATRRLSGASKDRPAPERRNRGTSENAGEQTAADAAAGDGIGLHFLGTQLRSLPLFEVAMMTGYPWEIGPGLLEMIDTEEKQLQLIEDLYLIVKAQPKYKALKEPKLTVDSSPLTVIYWLLRKLAPLAKGNDWTIDTYEEAGRSRYRFVVYKRYNSQKLVPGCAHLPLDFLPGLIKRDKPLHDLIIDIVALVSKFNKVPLWDVDGDYSVAVENLMENSYSVNHFYAGQFHSYKQGIAAQYLRLINSRKRTVTVADLYEGLRNYNASSNRKNSLVWWIKEGIKLAEKKQCITRNSYVPNYRPGSPVTPFRLYKFIWCDRNGDVVHEYAHRQIQIDREYGLYVPVAFSIAKPGQKIKELAHDKFPIDLYQFISYGAAHLWANREYYYKKKPYTFPAEELLENIEIQELQQQLTVRV